MNVLHNWIKTNLYKPDSVVQGVPWAGNSQLVSLSQIFRTYEFSILFKVHWNWF